MNSMPLVGNQWSDECLLEVLLLFLWEVGELRRHVAERVDVSQIGPLFLCFLLGDSFFPLALVWMPLSTVKVESFPPPRNSFLAEFAISFDDLEMQQKGTCKAV